MKTAPCQYALVLLATFLFLSNLTLGLATARAQARATAPPEFDAQNGSLLKVPQTAGYYFSTMNHQAVVNRFFESNAWKRLKKTDVAKGMKKAYRRGKSRGYKEYNEENPFAVYLKGYGESIGSVAFQSVWQFAKEVVNNELFIYVDNDAIPFNNAMVRVQSLMMESLRERDGGNGQAAAEALLEALQNTLNDDFADLQCPTMIMGARLEDPDGFRGILGLLQGLAEQAMITMPEDYQWAKDWWRVVDEDEHYLMAIDIDLSKMPLDEWLEEANRPEIAEILEGVAKSKKASIVLGIVDDLLILGVASDKQKLIDFGSGPLLIDMPLAGKLRKSVDQGDTIINVFYISKQCAASATSMQQAADTWKYSVLAVSEMMEFETEVEKAAFVQEVSEAFDELKADFKATMPPPGGTLSHTKLGEEGVHMTAVHESKLPSLDATKPLDLAGHASQDTIAFVLQRSGTLTQQYAFVSKWSAKIFDLVDRYGKDAIIDGVISDMEEEEDLEEGVEEKARRIVDIAFTNVSRIMTKFDTVTRTRLLPAIDEQQLGLFVDMVKGPVSWCADMEPSKEPLGLPLPALVMGHNDSQKLIEAGARYLDIVNESIRLTVDTVAEFAPSNAEQAAKFKVRAPDRVEDGAEVSFRWNFLTENFRADPSLRTGARVSEQWLVLNMHEGQARRLTGGGGSPNLFGPANTDQPSAILAFFDNRVLMREARRWLRYASTRTRKSAFDMSVYEAERDTLQFSKAQLLEAAERVWEIGECFKGISMRSWETDQSTETEILFKFNDVAP